MKFTEPTKATNSWCSSKNNINVWVAGSTVYLKTFSLPYNSQDQITMGDFHDSDSVAISMLRSLSSIEGRQSLTIGF